MSTDNRTLMEIVQRLNYLEKEIERMKGHDVARNRDPIHFEFPVLASVNFSPATGKSGTAKTKITMSTEFPTAPTTEVIGYYFYVADRDSGSAASACYLILSSESTAGNGVFVDPTGLTNDSWERNMVWVPCDANGDIYYGIVASGAGTFDFYLNLAGWIYKS